MRYIMATVWVCFSTLAAASVTDPGVTRALDVARKALEDVQAAAGEGDMAATGKALAYAHERWLDASKRYRDIVTRDEKWVPDFDAIQAAIQQAIAEYDRLGSANKATIQDKIGQALSTLQALRDRNGVPDFRADLIAARDALNELSETVESLKGQDVTEDSLLALERALRQAMSAWSAFTNSAVATNAMGLDKDKLGVLEKAAAAQDRLFAELDAALGAKNRRAFIQALAQARRAIGRVMQLAGALIPGDALPD